MKKRMFFFSLEDFVYDSMQSICVKHNMNKYEQKKRTNSRAFIYV